jgi:hypothetical protein
VKKYVIVGAGKDDRGRKNVLQGIYFLNNVMCGKGAGWNQSKESKS